MGWKGWLLDWSDEQNITIHRTGTDQPVRMLCYSKTLAPIPIICLQGYLRCLRQRLHACLHLGKRTIHILFTFEPTADTHYIKYVRIDILHTFRFDFRIVKQSSIGATCYKCWIFWQ